MGALKTRRKLTFYDFSGENASLKWDDTNKKLSVFVGTTEVVNWTTAGEFQPALAAGGVTVTTAATTVKQETGDGTNFTTLLTLTNFAVGTSGDNASLGIGAKLFDFPAGAYTVKRVTINLGLTATISVTAQTPVVGFGSVIASGAVAVLSGTATFQDSLAGVAVADVAGTKKLYANTPPTAPLVIATAGSHAFYLNVAVAWADVTAAGPVVANGTVMIEWAKIS